MLFALMRAKDLKYPYSGQERSVCLQEGVLFLPSYQPEGDSFVFPGWEAIFHNDNPIAIEYCSGNGSWIVEKAAVHSEKNWVAVEKRFERVRKIWSKGMNLGLSNLFIVCGEASQLSSRYIPEASVAEVFINFPDPWPKKRHAKNRLIQQPFVHELARILQRKRPVTLVTDDPDYSEQMISRFLGCSAFESSHPSPYYIPCRSDYGTSFFDQLWRGKGRQVRHHQFVRGEY